MTARVNGKSAAAPIGVDANECTICMCFHGMLFGRGRHGLSLFGVGVQLSCQLCSI